MPRLFALDQNFPEPLLDAAAPFLPEVELVPIRVIDPRLSDMDDWEILLTLHLHVRPWDGLITTDSSMLGQPRELATLRQTNLTLVVARATGHDPIRATGLVLTHRDYICDQTTDAQPQVWDLSARSRPATDPWDLLEKAARHQHRTTDTVWREARLTAEELRTNPLAG